MSLETRLTALAERVAAEFNAVRAEMGPSGSFSLSSATVTIAPAVRGRVVFSIADAAATPSTRVIAMLAPNADHDVEWLEGYALHVTCGAEVVRGVITHPGPIAGSFTIHYSLG